MSEIHWRNTPRLSQPVILAAFEGWNDASDAATGALDHLCDAWGTEELAEIDPELFYDFTAARPYVVSNDGEPSVIWPQNRFSAVSLPDGPDVIVLRGTEPQLRWRTFADQVLAVADRYDASLLLTVGALLADIPHSRPTPVYGTAYEQRVIDALHLEPSTYEGPTGIVGVLHDRCKTANVHSAALWAAVPSYVSAAPSPKAALALVQRIGSLIGIEAPMGTLEAETAAYETQITELVDDDPETLEYVSQLEEAHDSDSEAVDNAGALVDEVERFLRGL